MIVKTNVISLGRPVGKKKLPQPIRELNSSVSKNDILFAAKKMKEGVERGMGRENESDREKRREES